jgi:hypothetical protein
MRFGHDLNLLAIERRREAQPGLLQGIGRHEHVDVVTEKRAYASELQTPLTVDIDIDIGPTRKIMRDDLPTTELDPTWRDAFVAAYDT